FCSFEAVLASDYWRPSGGRITKLSVASNYKIAVSFDSSLAKMFESLRKRYANKTIVYSI
ncbi:MAG: hypothetical protein WB586_30130, partial [Chthoniobacterales bacterium]